jgi:L-seryl-tRNA(Ser) seleniumtransferase
MRALRVDKMTLAALDATLRLYRNPQQALQQIPLLAMVSTSIENLHNRADRLAPQMAAATVIETAEPVEDTAQLGGGSVPAQDIPTWCVALTPHGISVDELAKFLRTGMPPVVGRVSRDRLLLDLRTVLPEQDSLLVDAVTSAGQEKAESESG